MKESTFSPDSWVKFDSGSSASQSISFSSVMVRTLLLIRCHCLENQEATSSCGPSSHGSIKILYRERPAGGLIRAGYAKDRSHVVSAFKWVKTGALAFCARCSELFSWQRSLVVASGAASAEVSIYSSKMPAVAVLALCKSPGWSVLTKVWADAVKLHFCDDWKRARP